MSYEDLLKFDAGLSALRRGQDPALFHRGDYRRLLRIHEQHIARAATLVDFPAVEPFLMRRIADFRTLRLACESLRRKGRKSPGPGGLQLQDMQPVEIHSMCRQLARSLRDGGYRPGPDQKRRIPKEGHQGEFRRLTIQSMPDRVVGKAALMILQPLVDRDFQPFSFGFRPKRDTHSALATLLTIVEQEGRRVLVSVDLAKAFDRIPFAQFLVACRTRFPDDVVNFISLITHTGKKKGLRQGSPFSPLAFNLFADHFIDRTWQQRSRELPLIRYADDLLVPCRTMAEAADAYQILQKLARSAGVPIKESSSEAIHDLSTGDLVNWLGFELRREGDDIAIKIAQRAWDKLNWHLQKCHFQPAAPLRARQVIRGWLNYLGPCYPHESHVAILRSLRQTALSYAFDEIPSDDALLNAWRAAHARWHRVWSAEAQILDRRLATIRGEQPSTPSVSISNEVATQALFDHESRRM